MVWYDLGEVGTTIVITNYNILLTRNKTAPALSLAPDQYREEDI